MLRWEEFCKRHNWAAVVQSEKKFDKKVENKLEKKICIRASL